MIKLHIFILFNFFLINTICGSRIGILSYGSLVKRSTHSVTGARLRATKFAPLSIYFPINLSFLKNKNRITAVVDNEDGLPKRLWIATSHFTSMTNAMQNLAFREGAPYLKDEKKYDTQYIFYIRKLTAGESKQENEQSILHYKNWVIHDTENLRQQLDSVTVATLVELAVNMQFDALLWVSCPHIIISKENFIKRLLDDDTTLKNAQKYIQMFADGPQTDLEKGIIAGKQVLKEMQDERK